MKPAKEVFNHIDFRLQISEMTNISKNARILIALFERLERF